MLVLPIKREWFDMIRNGEKKEEYREIKPYYTSRFEKLFPYNIHTNKSKVVSNLRFLSIHLEVNLKTGKVEKIVNYDPRVIERKKEKLLHKYINKFIKKMLKHTLNEKKDK